MERFGFIHEKVDIKKLILFILGRLEAPVDLNTLTELTLLDDGISYFDYSECLAELQNAENIHEENGRYSITEKGRRNGKILEDTLPYIVRRRAEEKTLPLVRSQRRDSMVKSEIRTRPGGGFTLVLSLSDGLGEIWAMELYAANEARAQTMAQSFTKRAEELYSTLIASLTDGK